MTHYDRDYTKIDDPVKKDDEAILDIQEYCDVKQWQLLMQLAEHPEATIHQVLLSFMFVGIQGYPFHAFCRRYMLDKYREWMANGEDGPVPTNEQGFPLRH